MILRLSSLGKSSGALLALAIFAPVVPVQASDYNQEAGINYSSNSNSQYNDHSAAISADFTYNFAPTFITGPVTQHAYWQKISQFKLKSDRRVSDSRAGSNNRSNELALCLFPPGRAMYMNLAVRQNVIATAPGETDQTLQTELNLGVFSSRKLSYGIHVGNSNSRAMEFSESLFRDNADSRGIFIKNIMRSNLNYYLLYLLNINKGRFDQPDNTTQEFIDARIHLALYPDRRQEWALVYHQYQFDNVTSKADTRLLSYTNYFNKVNGIVIQLEANRNTLEEQRRLSLGWKIRL